MDGERCPDCGSTSFVEDGSSIICSHCGLVVVDTKYAHPFTPKLQPDSFAMMGRLGSSKPSYLELVKYRDRYLRLVGRCNGREKTEVEVAVKISMIVGRIGAPKYVEVEAAILAKRMLKAMRAKNKRLTTTEVAIASVWGACKVHGFPITLKEFSEAIGFQRGAKSLLKLLNKVDEVFPLPKAVRSPKEYIPRLASKLMRSGVPRDYALALQVYASTICDALADKVSGKSPPCIASTALVVADELMGGVVGRERMLQIMGSGFSQSLAKSIKSLAPPPPSRVAEVGLRYMLKKVMEVRAYEMAGNAPG